jgi:hypothetical protein
MARLTDRQLIILSAASQHNDREVELPASVKGEGARKLVDKLIRAGLLEFGYIKDRASLSQLCGIKQMIGFSKAKNNEL